MRWAHSPIDESFQKVMRFTLSELILHRKISEDQTHDTGGGGRGGAVKKKELDIESSELENEKNCITRTRISVALLHRFGARNSVVG
jgi:hypothetical protein